MGDTQNFIEINGKKYDAVTGVMLGDSSQKTTVIPIKKPVVDGFVKRPAPARVHTTTATHAAHKHEQHVQKSKTLMRHAVKKPTEKLLKPTASDIKVTKTAYGKATVTPRTNAIPEHRQKHAQTVQKSTLVNKFGPSVASPITAKVTPLEVRPVPVHAQVTTSSTHKKTSELLEKALQAAEGHNEPHHKTKRRIHHRIAKKVGISGRAVVITGTVVGAIVIGGFYAYQNVPRLAIKVASSRAGFSAAMPAYSPSGFSFNGPVQYSEGQVSVGFKSNTDSREYKITQQTSDWSSESLLNNFITNAGRAYQTYQDRGKTIYIYDNNNATWVDNGVWFQIEGKSQLTTDQLVKIASSL